MEQDLAQLLRSVVKEELTPVVEQVVHRFDQIDQRLDQMDQRLVRVEDDKQLIKQAVLETNERVIRMESLLTNQQHIIELLSVRSIEQEAQLKKIV
jgi:uncharacterized UPF0160 family protein